MNQATTTESISLRKGLLQAKISKAKSIEDYDHLSSLTAQWVHRYGLESFDEIELKAMDEVGIKSIQESSSQVDLSQSYREVKEATSLEISDGSSIEEFDSKTFECVDLKPSEELNDDVTGSMDSVNAQIGYSPKKEIYENSDQNLIDLDNFNAPAPPCPSISHFRRWLTSFDNSSRKAS